MLKFEKLGLLKSKKYGNMVRFANHTCKVVVYYDELNSSKAWLQLKFFTYNVEVDPIAVERIKEDKSLVDHKLLPVFQKQYISMMWIL